MPAEVGDDAADDVQGFVVILGVVVGEAGDFGVDDGTAEVMKIIVAACLTCSPNVRTSLNAPAVGLNS